MNTDWTNTDWTSKANCKNIDTELFFPASTQETGNNTDEETISISETRKIVNKLCKTCPVRLECLNDAMTYEKKYYGYRHGYFGGYSPRERSRLEANKEWRKWLKQNANKNTDTHS